jgi:hypothetical protein
MEMANGCATGVGAAGASGNAAAAPPHDTVASAQASSAVTANRNLRRRSIT